MWTHLSSPSQPTSSSSPSTIVWESLVSVLPVLLLRNLPSGQCAMLCRVVLCVSIGHQREFHWHSSDDLSSSLASCARLSECVCVCVCVMVRTKRADFRFDCWRLTSVNLLLIPVRVCVCDDKQQNRIPAHTNVVHGRRKEERKLRSL